MRLVFLQVVVIGLAASVGCVHIDHTGYDAAIRCAADHPIKPAFRSQVHLFVLNGVNPTEDVGLIRLRDEVVKSGFPMVHLAQRADADFYHREMHRLVRDQPAARFVLVGYGLSTGKACELACSAAGEGLPLDALVLLDPTGGPDLIEERVQVTVIRSHHWPAGRNIAAEQTTECVGVGHLSLPMVPQTVAAVVGLLANSATRVELESPPKLPHLPLNEFPQPPPRPQQPVVIVSPEPATHNK